MNPKNPLDSVYFIDLPENFSLSDAAFPIDKTIQLPVQQKDSDAPGVFNPKEITMEQILAGILTVLAYDKKNPEMCHRKKDYLFTRYGQGTHLTDQKNML